MRFARLLLSFVLATSLLIPIAAPQTPTSSQAVQYLQKALAAISSTPLTDVTFTGNAHYIAGTDDETGTATLKAIVGASRIDLNLSSGPRSEIQNVVVGAPVGSWSGPDGVSHATALHNLLTDPAWFFPAFSITHGLGAGYAATYEGQENRNGEAVAHLTISQTSAVQSPVGAPTISHLSQMDFFLDSTTLLPAAVTFSIHPDNNALLDIPIEVRFSDYRAVNGVQVPFHVEKFFNNTLLLDLQFQTVTVNSGLTGSSFAVQQGAL